MATKTKEKPVVQIMTSIKAIDAAIKDTNLRGVTLQHDMHTLACSVLAHIGKHKDMRVLDRFIKAVPDMVRVNSIKLWFETFGCVAFTGADGKALECPAYVSTKKTRLGDAMVKPFWSFKAKEGEEYQALDFNKFAEATIAKLKKDADKTGRDYNELLLVLKTFKPVEKPVAA